MWFNRTDLKVSYDATYLSGHKIGVDASNMVYGGGKISLIEMLNACRPGEFGISKIVVWGDRAFLSSLTDAPWFIRVEIPSFCRSKLLRKIWKFSHLTSEARRHNCNLLFVPDGIYFGSFKPFLSMHHNFLPFLPREIRRYGFSYRVIKFHVLRYFQAFTFRRSSGVIFLSNHAKEVVSRMIGLSRSSCAVIPHGISRKFYWATRVQREITTYCDLSPFSIVYSSSYEPYKHHEAVFEAIFELRNRTGWPISLKFVGPGRIGMREKIFKYVNQRQADCSWLTICGPVPYHEMSDEYKRGDLGIMASTCETFGMTALEYAMAGLPIACTKYLPLPELLGDAAVYFDPEDVADMVAKLEMLIGSSVMRSEYSRRASTLALKFDWENSAHMFLQYATSIFRARSHD